MSLINHRPGCFHQVCKISHPFPGSPRGLQGTGRCWPMTKWLGGIFKLQMLIHQTLDIFFHKPQPVHTLHLAGNGEHVLKSILSLSLCLWWLWGSQNAGASQGQDSGVDLALCCSWLGRSVKSSLSTPSGLVNVLPRHSATVQEPPGGSGSSAFC